MNGNGRKLRWGIISTGNISQKFCVALSKIDEPNYHVVKSVAARDISSAKKFAEKFNIANYYGSYDELCKDPEVDIVYVGVINSVHKSACLKAIENGKHVLCEKPMTMNAKQQEEVINAAKAKGVFLMEVWQKFN
jgi:dihydrodiol dehydrogenase / D-xylose 1-dehydrogenase (NADP)